MFDLENARQVCDSQDDCPTPNMVLTNLRNACDEIAALRTALLVAEGKLEKAKTVFTVIASTRQCPYGTDCFCNACRAREALAAIEETK